ncbi:protein DpdH [Moritella dasanensis]|uniref:protein DpdH n=1 Tax=Moritella dasanensis TaxID=428031 RepID=UPI0002E0115A|nr:protein DpdH [Moritella dasanensis]
MSIKNYWPALQNVKSCIYSEAEELSDALLLAVHTPMRLVSTTFVDPQPLEKTEHDLLTHLLNTKRPIPIVGESGGGKSHLVRWLHAKLELEQIVKDEKWHIVRIPKNATMVQVLTRLLNGLEGEAFEQVRQGIMSVGSKISQELITGLFYTYLQESFKVIREDSEHKAKDAKKNKDLTQAQKFKDKSNIAKNLKICFSDPVFKSFFTGDSKPITNTIERLSQSKSYSEVYDAVYSVSVDDINVSKNNSFELDELSRDARKAFEALRFFTSNDFENEPRAKMSVEIINQAVNDTTKLVFKHLFTFNNGSFQDLFIDIRRALKDEDRTLVILVEDLAAISAIDDVLLDSLLQEDIYDGKQELCPLKSVIATTTEQETYLKRRETILTRSTFEWRIPTDEDLRKIESTTNDIDLVVDFCGRYLNAARLGIEVIESHYLKGNTSVPIWSWSEELSEHDENTLSDFGYTSNSTPLFPFNRTAISNLAKLKVYRKGSSKFNPRIVIKELLIPILRDNHSDFQGGIYPSTNFTDKFQAICPDSIRDWSMSNTFDKPMRNRLNSFLTIYASSYGVRQSFNEIKDSITTNQVEAFNLPSDKFNELAVIVERCTKCSEKLDECVCGTVESKCPECSNLLSGCICKVLPKCNSCGKSKTECVCSETELLEIKINDWFNNKTRLDAVTSNDIRKHLLEVLNNDATLSHYGLVSTNKWGGNKSLFDFALKGARYNIYIPKSVASIDLEVVSICKEGQLNDSDESFKLKKQIIAIVRYDYHKKKGNGWNYPQGFDDYSYYMEFFSAWIPSAIKLCLNHVRIETPKLLAKQKSLSIALGFKDDIKDYLNLFIQKSLHIADKLPVPINSDFAQLQQQLLKDWDEIREQWLMRVSYSPSSGGGEVGVDAPLFFKYLKDSKAHKEQVLSAEQRRLFRSAKTDISDYLMVLFKATQDFVNTDDAQEQLQVLDDVYSSIPPEMMPGSLTIRKAKNHINKLKENYEWSIIENSRKFVNADDEIEELRALYKINGEKLKQWLVVLEDFNNVKSSALLKLQRSNIDNGGDKMNEYKSNIELYFDVIDSAIGELEVKEEVSNDL